LAFLTSVSLSFGHSETTVQGSLSGNNPALSDAYFVQQDHFFPNGDGLMLVQLSSVSDSCSQDSAFHDDTLTAATAEDAEALWRTHMPEDFWTAHLLFRVNDLDKSLSRLSPESVSLNEPLTKSGQASAEFIHYQRALDAPYWSGENTAQSAYYQQWWSKGGTFEIVAQQPGEVLAGHLATIVVQGEHDTVQEDLSMEFVAQRCRSMEPHIFGSDFNAYHDPTALGAGPGQTETPYSRSRSATFMTVRAQPLGV
jgi:hypothetical protein